MNYFNFIRTISFMFMKRHSLYVAWNGNHWKTKFDWFWLNLEKHMTYISIILVMIYSLPLFYPSCGLKTFEACHIRSKVYIGGVVVSLIYSPYPFFLYTIQVKIFLHHWRTKQLSTQTKALNNVVSFMLLYHHPHKFLGRWCSPYPWCRQI